MKTQGPFRLGFLGGLLITTALLTVSIPILNGATGGTHQVRPDSPPPNLSFEAAVGFGRLVDKTGLAGLYDFEVGPWRSDPAPNFQPDSNALEVRADPESLPTIFTALQEKLGLRLERQRAEVEVLVIDSADKPK